MDVNELYSQASNGNEEAQFNLAVAYENGTEIEKNLTQAIFWYTKLAEKGYASAQYNLGNCYQDDSMVSKDFAAAAYWYGKAVEQGHLNATYMLAVCYKNGEGVVQDTGKAKSLFMTAANKNHEPSQRMLVKIAEAEKEAQREARDIVTARAGIQYSPPPIQNPVQYSPQNTQNGLPSNQQAPLYQPQKKKMHGCLIAIIVVVGIFVALILFSYILKVLGLS